MTDKELADLIERDGLQHAATHGLDAPVYTRQIVAALRAQAELVGGVETLVEFYQLDCDRGQQTYASQSPLGRAWDAVRAALAKVKESAR